MASVTPAAVVGFTVANTGEGVHDLPLDIPVTVDGDLIGGSGTLRAIEAEILLDYGEERADEDTRILALTGEVHITDNGPAGPRTSTRTTWASRSTASGSSRSTPRRRPPPPTCPPAPPPRPPGSSSSRPAARPASLHFGSGSPDDAKGAAFTFPELP